MSGFPEQAVSGNRLAVPAYLHAVAHAAQWAVLADAAPRLRAVVVNVDSGPGSAPVPALREMLHPLAEQGVSLLGYADTDYGRRPAGLVRAEIARYRSWYPVTGVFLDRAAAGARWLAWYARIADWARGQGAASVVLNHGVHPDRRYAALADALVTFEGAWPEYRWLRVPAWVHELDPGRFWHLVYGTPGNRLAAALGHAAGSHAATVYVTDRAGDNPWGTLATYFEQEARDWAS